MYWSKNYELLRIRIHQNSCLWDLANSWEYIWERSIELENVAWGSIYDFMIIILPLLRLYLLLHQLVGIRMKLSLALCLPHQAKIYSLEFFILVLKDKKELMISRMKFAQELDVSLNFQFYQILSNFHHLIKWKFSLHSREIHENKQNFF